MPTKHNKLRYQSADKPRARLTLTGCVYLQYRDEEAIAAAQKGDVMLYPSVEALHTIRQGEYDTTGHAGYFKADVCDGKTWQPLLLTGLFDARENHFSKSERPADTFSFCAPIVQDLKGRMVERTYREHFRLLDDENEEENKT